MAYGLSQCCVVIAGLGLKVEGSIEGYAGLMVIAVPIHVIGMPVKKVSVDGAIFLNQLLFHKVVAIQVDIAQPGAGKVEELDIRKSAKDLREGLVSKLDEGVSVIHTGIREQMNGFNVQVGALCVL